MNAQNISSNDANIPVINKNKCKLLKHYLSLNSNIIN